MASPEAIQPLAVLVPSPSWSKRMGEAGLMALVVMPEPSRSRTRGSRLGGTQFRASTAAVLVVGSIFRRSASL